MRDVCGQPARAAQRGLFATLALGEFVAEVEAAAVVCAYVRYDATGVFRFRANVRSVLDLSALRYKITSDTSVQAST
jgi:hypothetical protein